MFRKETFNSDIQVFAFDDLSGDPFGGPEFAAFLSFDKNGTELKEAHREFLASKATRVLRNPIGFAEIYGDYGEMGITNTGKTFAAWGEGFSYTGPGGTWINVQR